jgi:hypothetical protein
MIRARSTTRAVRGLVGRIAVLLVLLTTTVLMAMSIARATDSDPSGVPIPDGLAPVMGSDGRPLLNPDGSPKRINVDQAPTHIPEEPSDVVDLDGVPTVEEVVDAPPEPIP